MEVSCQVSNRSFDPGYRRVTLKRQGEDYIPFRGQGYFLDTRWPTNDTPNSLPEIFRNPVNQYLRRNFRSARMDIPGHCGGGENQKKKVANLWHDAKLKRIIEQKNYLYFLFFFRELKLVENGGFFKVFKISFTPWKKIACFFDLWNIRDEARLITNAASLSL